MSAPGVGRARLALVIGSGGLKCAAAVGVMQVLECEGIPVDLVVGCSVGSVFGSLIALGFTANQMIDAARRSWTSKVTSRLDFRSLLKILAPKLAGFDEEIGIIDDRNLYESIANSLGAETTFADTRIPFYCLATDFHTGKPVVLSEGLLAKAVRISSGIPIVFKPVLWNGSLLVDGALSNPLPVDVAIQHGSNVILAVGFENTLLPPVSSIGNFVMQMFNILVNQLLYKQFAYYNLTHDSEIIVILPEFRESIRINDVSKTPFIIEQGRLEAEKHIPYLKKVLYRQTQDSK